MNNHSSQAHFEGIKPQLCLIIYARNVKECRNVLRMDVFAKMHGRRAPLVGGTATNRNVIVCQVARRVGLVNGQTGLNQLLLQEYFSPQTAFAARTLYSFPYNRYKHSRRSYVYIKIKDTRGPI